MRAIVFASSYSSKATILTEAALRATGFSVGAVCDAASMPVQSRWKRNLRLAGGAMLRRLSGRSTDAVRPAALSDARSLAAKYRVPLVSPPNRSVNDPDFVRRLRDEFRPDLALTLGCPQILGDELLGVFRFAVNHHSGLLPDYRGWEATAWSVYHGESRTGYSYHYLTAAVDAGAVLVSESIPVGGHSTIRLEIQKAELAAEQLDEAVRMAAEGDPGTAQTGEGSCFTREATRRITTIDEPGEHTWSELERRMRAFGSLWIRFGGQRVRATRLSRDGDGGLAFRTRDGVEAAATLFDGFPWPVYRLLGRAEPVSRRAPLKARGHGVG